MLDSAALTSTLGLCETSVSHVKFLYSIPANLRAKFCETENCFGCFVLTVFHLFLYYSDKLDKLKGSEHSLCNDVNEVTGRQDTEDMPVKDKTEAVLAILNRQGVVSPPELGI